MFKYWTEAALRCVLWTAQNDNEHRVGSRYPRWDMNPAPRVNKSLSVSEKLKLLRDVDTELRCSLRHT